MIPYFCTVVYMYIQYFQTTQAPCTVEVEPCGSTCQKALQCGTHICPERCHRGLCGQCLVIIEKKCRCGLYTKEIPCSRLFLCETKCKQVRDCNKHACSRKVSSSIPFPPYFTNDIFIPFIFDTSAAMAIVQRVIRYVEKCCLVENTSVHHFVIMANATLVIWRQLWNVGEFNLWFWLIHKTSNTLENSY